MFRRNSLHVDKEESPFLINVSDLFSTIEFEMTTKMKLAEIKKAYTSSEIIFSPISIGKEQAMQGMHYFAPSLFLFKRFQRNNENTIYVIGIGQRLQTLEYVSTDIAEYMDGRYHSLGEDTLALSTRLREKFKKSLVEWQTHSQMATKHPEQFFGYFLYYHFLTENRMDKDDARTCAAEKYNL